MPKTFNFYESNQDQDPRFSCKLQSQRCVSAKASGKGRCGNKTVMGVPVCWIHLLKDHKLRIAKSRIAEAGKGLFATKSRSINPNPQRTAENLVFRRDEKIIEYVGDRIDGDEMANRYGNQTAPYSLETKKDHIVDAACKRGAAAFANHKPFAQANARFSRSPDGKIWIRATKHIYDGDEIYLYYGSSYKFSDGSKHRTI